MEGIGDMGMIGENFDAVAMGRSSREDEYESRSGSDNLDGGASGDDLDAPLGKSSRKKKYHRHTPYQIQQLEAYVFCHSYLYLLSSLGFLFLNLYVFC